MVITKFFTAQFGRFAASSALGLFIDIAGFWLASALGVEPFLANITSASASITVVYLLVSRFTFAARTSWMSYVAFFGWYATSILIFSSLISYFSYSIGGAVFLWKALSVPFSFTLNFLFSRFLFVKLQGKLSP